MNSTLRVQQSSDAYMLSVKMLNVRFHDRPSYMPWSRIKPTTTASN